MGLVNDIGVATGFTHNRIWKLVSLDNPKVKFQGQFPAENLTENVGAQYGIEGTIGGQSFSAHYLLGDDETITFQARLYRTSPIKGAAFDALSNPVGTAFAIGSALEDDPASLDADFFVGNGSVRDEIEKLKSFARATDAKGTPNKMGRPHRFLLTIGTELEFEGYVKSVGGVKYDELRSDGTLRGATFQILFQKTSPENALLKQAAGLSLGAILKTGFGVVSAALGAAGMSFNPASVLNIPGASLHRISKTVMVKQGMSFESIARAEYGNPLLGDVLRRTQPEKAILKAGDEIALVRREEIVQIAVTPQSVALRDDSSQRALIKNYLVARGKAAAIVL